MSSTSQSFSQGTSRRASFVDKVLLTIEEMNLNIEQNNENARQTEKFLLAAQCGIINVIERRQSAVETNI